MGFSTEIVYYPEDKLTIVVLAKLTRSTPGANATELGGVAHGETVVLSSERREVAVATATLAKYVGTYELMPHFEIVLTLEGGQLMTQATGQGKFPVFAV